MLENINQPKGTTLDPKLADIVIKGAGLIYASIQVYGMLNFYLDTVGADDLLQTMAIGMGSTAKESKPSPTNQADNMLDPQLLDDLFDETVSEHVEVQAAIKEISAHCQTVFNSHYEKIKKGTAALGNEDAMESALLTLHKLNFLAVDRFFTKQLLKNRNVENMKQDDIAKLVEIKNSLIAVIQSATTVSKEASYVTGQIIGATLSPLGEKLTSAMDENHRATLQNYMSNFSKALSSLSPIGYAGYQAYKVSKKLFKGGCQAALVPANVATVMASGFLTGFVDVAVDGATSDVSQAYNTSMNQSWGEFSRSMFNSCTALCSNVASDLKTSYNAARTSRDKFLGAIEKGGVDTGFQLKPHKSGQELLFFTLTSQEAAKNDASWYKKAGKDLGVMINSGFKAVAGVSAKYIYKASEHVGQATGDMVKNILTKKDFPQQPNQSHER